MADVPRGGGNQEIIASMRRHAAALAGDLLAMRRALDVQLAGMRDYGAALAAIADGIQQVQDLAREIDRGAVVARQTLEPGLAHGDLDSGGEIVTRTGGAG